MRILEAMYRRKSVRNFEDAEIENDLMLRIRTRLNKTEELFQSSGISCVISEYSKGTSSAPYYIGVYTDDSKYGQINAGYVLEQISVYLSAIGIASCYREGNGLLRPVDSQGRKLTIALAFGYPKEKMYRNKGEEKRLDKNKVCVVKESPNEDIERLLELALLAPSSYNVQPWRFVVYHNRIHVFVKNKMIRRVRKQRYINMGVMLGNMMLGADELWIDLKLREVADIKAKDYGEYEYIVSVYHKNCEGRVV